MGEAFADEDGSEGVSDGVAGDYVGSRAGSPVEGGAVGVLVAGSDPEIAVELLIGKHVVEGLAGFAVAGRDDIDAHTAVLAALELGLEVVGQLLIGRDDGDMRG